MALASNLLNALGGAPCLTERPYLPSYPCGLIRSPSDPNGSGAGAELALLPLSKHAIKMMLRIERPEWDSRRGLTLLGRLGHPRSHHGRHRNHHCPHCSPVVRYDDPVIITERVAAAAFIAGYTDPTRRSCATDLRIFAGWCHDHGINLLNVKRPASAFPETVR